MNLKRYYITVAFVFLLTVLVASIISACAPATVTPEGPVVAEITIQETGVPAVTIEKRILYDRNNNAVGYRFYDSETAQYCYYIGGDLSCPSR